jgi:LDH2 family malate/lactate/ureidoglycolate dehydrogenase
MIKTTIRITAKILFEYINNLFLWAGLNEEEAGFHSESIINTSLWGIDSHGIIRVPVYFDRIQRKAINLNPHITRVSSFMAFEILDGDKGSGFTVGRAAMKRAIELAEQFGIGAVGVKSSNHFGAASIYSRIAVDNGMIGYSSTNVKPLMVLRGASKPVVGNNPFSIAIPTFGEFPFVLDISMSRIAGGKLALAIKKNEKIPLDWATDENGMPTDDPQKAFKGFLLPIAEHKGLGLAYAIDIICGVLTGGAFQTGVKSMYEFPDDPSNTGHFMMAFNCNSVMDKEILKSRMQEYINNLKNTPLWDMDTKVYLPGEIEYLNSLDREENGIPIPEKTYSELLELSKRTGISMGF